MGSECTPFHALPCASPPLPLFPFNQKELKRGWGRHVGTGQGTGINANKLEVGYVASALTVETCDYAKSGGEWLVGDGGME